MTKTFKVQAPIGNSIVPKEVMNEQELRDHALLLLEPTSHLENRLDPWVRKVKEDPIEDVAEWLRNLGYQVELVK